MGFCLEYSDKRTMFHVFYGLDLSCIFVQHCGISRNKHLLSGVSDLSALIHVCCNSCYLLPHVMAALQYAPQHKLCGPLPEGINTEERKCFFMQHETVVLQEPLQYIILLNPISVTSKRELEMCVARNTCL